MTRSPSETMAERLAAALTEHGVTTAFGVPGGGANLDVVGAMNAAGIRFVLAHGETSACIMASVHGHLTGTPAPAVVTRGPGAASAVNGAAQATLDRHPLTLITDTVPTATAARVPHQRLDQCSMLAPVTKRSAPFGPDTAVETLSSLLAVATESPAGAVHLDYDIQSPAPRRTDEPADDGTRRSVGGIHDLIEAVDAVAKRVAAASHPVVIIGVGALGEADDVRKAVERFGAPTLATYQGAGVLPTENDLSAGLFTNGESERPLVERADLIVTIGLDPVEPRSAPWPYEAPVISLAPHPTDDPYVPIETELVGDLGWLTDAVLRSGHRWPADEGTRFRAQVRRQLTDGRSDGFGPLELVDSLVAATVDALGPDGPTVTVDAGAHFLAIMPFWPIEQPKRLLISNGLATMGYALPAAIGAALARPDEPVLCLVGDGGLGMTLSELETVARLDLPITTVVFNDSGLSLIEIKQGAAHGGRDAVGYRTTDFAALAETMGVAGTIARSADEVSDALTGPWDRPRLIDARIDPSHYRHLIRVTRG